MPRQRSTNSTEFTTFGALLKYLRRRAQLTQTELATACGYSPPHISRLEKNQRLPDRVTLLALFVPALKLEDEPEVVDLLLKLADFTRAKHLTGASASVEPAPIKPARNNLPVQVTPFIGRGAELEALAQLIADPHTRLVTIVGPGGMGKTRLSIEIAAGQTEYFADGVYFVSLAPISVPDLLILTIADAVKCPFFSGREPRQLLLDYFREKSLLLLLDNFEHLALGVHLITEILQAAPKSKNLDHVT